MKFISVTFGSNKMPVRSWRTGYGPRGGFSLSHETPDGILVYTRSVEHNHHQYSVEFGPGLRLQFKVYQLTEWVWGHGIGLTKIERGMRYEFVGLSPQHIPVLEWY